MTKVNISATEKATSRKGIPHRAHAKKNTSSTFWNDLRVENGYTLKLLADVLEVKQNYLSFWLTGQSKPTETFIKKICELFGVPISEGRAQFEAAYEIWHNTHGKTVKVAPRKNNPIIKDAVQKYVPAKTESKAEPKIEKEPEQIKTSNTDEILEVLFNILPCGEYTKVVLALNFPNQTKIEWEPILDLIYQKVDRKTYDFVRDFAR